MPSALTTANSYGTLAEADAYFDDRLGSDAWTSATDDDKTRALLQATLRIDLCRFEGARTSDAQARSWPRTGTYDRDNNELASDEVPAPVKHAQFEVALAVIEDPRWFSDRGTEGFDSVSAGPGTAYVVKHGHKAQELPKIAKRLLHPFIAWREPMWVV